MSEQSITSEVTGTVWKIEKSEGDSVEAEDVIMILESMKMEIPVEAPCAGRIIKILVSEQDVVEEEQVIVVIMP
ncbi:acetyl-CoA carboxylase biotin carboxyl carrier protein subunit [Kineobactrum sediminis]|uniref:Acetyl-CoA carboxylase biotin carboxyl carrier protein subunit n=1 Tax=Kineobactrum sediminis TaxID=1905677 RepID=A0A2N5XXS6_9GAMM|nr:acetyl-CoA carboxylase biotin carboxyl carrier protein subunit [Kineobactrum sediminis]PLW80954.1 acetyl-CoA carboxylase biotin carboxyl carrier protein subunit [Kineobactrum sediminis]